MAREDKSQTPVSGPFNNPFQKITGAKVAPAQAPASAKAAETPAASKGPERAVVRYERKGHGGKEMTRIEQLALPPRELERWLKELKQALGCGGVIDGSALLVQGDQRERLRAWLEKRGVKKVSLG